MFLVTAHVEGEHERGECAGDRVVTWCCIACTWCCNNYATDGWSVVARCSHQPTRHHDDLGNLHLWDEHMAGKHQQCWTWVGYPISAWRTIDVALHFSAVAMPEFQEAGGIPGMWLRYVGAASWMVCLEACYRCHRVIARSRMQVAMWDGAAGISATFLRRISRCTTVGVLASMGLPCNPQCWKTCTVTLLSHTHCGTSAHSHDGSTLRWHQCVL
jgi:hypothetical protein